MKAEQVIYPGFAQHFNNQSKIQKGYYPSVKDQFAQLGANISKLDPLNMDMEMKILPNMNRRGFLNGICATLKKKLPLPNEIYQFDFYESAAAMRDIGFFLGSIKKLGKEPLEVIPELDWTLTLLSEKTDLPPRDTLLHYTCWNPLGNRRRTYSDHQDEIKLIDSVRMAYPALTNAIWAIVKLYELDLTSPIFVLYSELIYMDIKQVVNGIVHATRGVSPQVFATELRHYFEPVTFEGKEYIGPGAVEMPLFIFDHILWGGGLKDDTYRKFKNTYLPFIAPDLRKIYLDFEEKPSLLSKTAIQLSESRTYHPKAYEAAKQLGSIMNLLKSFRIPHKKIADESYNNNDPNTKEKGSGGYSPEILTYILKLTQAKADEFQKQLKVYCKLKET